MRRLSFINTPAEQVPFGYANNELYPQWVLTSSAEGPYMCADFRDDRSAFVFSEDGAWDGAEEEEEEDWNGCCEDLCDEEDEDEEREWCD